MINVIANILGVAIVVGAIATVLDKRVTKLHGDILRNKRYIETQLMSIQSEIDKNVDSSNGEFAFVIDKIEAMDRELRGQTYAIAFWGGGFYGGFERNGDPVKVDYDEAVLLTRHEAELIRNKFGTGAIVNRSKTILKNLEDK